MQLVSCYLSAFIFHGLLALCGFKVYIYQLLDTVLIFRV